MVRAPVVIASVTFVGPLSVTGFEEASHEAAAGKPLQVSPTAWENVPVGVNVSVKSAVCPAEIVALGGCALIVKSFCTPTPVPVSMTICGLPGALSDKVSAPMLEPAACGVNVTLIVQLVPGCSGALVQSSVSENAPLATMLEKVIAMGP